MAVAIEFSADVFEAHVQYVADVVSAMNEIQCPNKECRDKIISVVVKEQTQAVHKVVEKNVSKLVFKRQREFKRESILTSLDNPNSDNQESKLRTRKVGGVYQSPVTMDGARGRMVVRKGDYDVEEADVVYFHDYLINNYGEKKTRDILEGMRSRRAGYGESIISRDINIGDIVTELVNKNPHIPGLKDLKSKASDKKTKKIAKTTKKTTKKKKVVKKKKVAKKKAVKKPR